MNQTDYKIPENISPNNFPAKLWRMVNNPANSAICWDKTGEGIVVDQHLFEKDVLSPSSKDDEEYFDYFKTTHFSSFVRQLNLYGFRKSETTSCIISSDDELYVRRSNTIHHFFNPNFRRDNPGRLVNLKRLTVENKAKMNSGTDVKCQAPGKPSSDKRAHNVMSPHPYRSRKLLQTTHKGTPVPPRHLAQGHILEHPYSTVLSTHQQGVRYGVNYGHPRFTGIHPQNEQYHPNFYSSACPCFRPPLMAMPNGMNGLLDPFHLYLQANSPLDLEPNSRGPGSQNKEQNQKVDVNLDRVFQIADEVMLSQPNNNLTKIVNPEMQSSFSAEGGLVIQPDFKTGQSMKQAPGVAIDEGTKKEIVKAEVIQVEVSKTSSSKSCLVQKTLFR